MAIPADQAGSGRRGRTFRARTASRSYGQAQLPTESAQPRDQPATLEANVPGARSDDAARTRSLAGTR